MRGTRVWACLSVLLCSFLFGAIVAEDGNAPLLSIERVEEVREIWLRDAAGLPKLLRETTAAVTLGPEGADPTGKGRFATWNEDGTRWFTFSRDGGQTWSEARSLKTAMRLRDGAIEPGQPMPAAIQGLTLPADGRVFLVQFRTIGLPEWREALSALGVEVLNYLPHNTHVVRLRNTTQLPSIRALEFVERVAPYQPAYRLSADLRGWLDLDGEAAEADPSLKVNVMAFEWGEEGKNRIAAYADKIGAEVISNWPNGHRMELQVDRGQLRVLAAHHDVLWIDRWTEPSTDMDLVREDGGTNYLETNYGWCGQGVRGEVMDSGFQTDHPDFDGILEHGPTDVSSHGTSTYGIVFGNGDRDGDGDGAGTGHMPCAEQGIAADYGFLGDRFAHTQELKEAPYFASFQTNSWGNSQVPNYTSVSSEMDDIVWRLDFAILNSQSNTGNQNSRPQAWGKNVISVGGINHENTLDPSDDNWSNGASIGPAEDGRIKPDINYWYDSIYTTTTGSGYTSGFGGTSAATPESAGILGLMIQMWSENIWGTDPEGSTVFERQPHFSTMKALLINNAHQYPFSGLSDDLTRVHQGWGRPNLQLADQRAPQSFIIDEEVVLELNDFGIYEVDVLAGESELKVTMVYPDPPGTTSASMHRINNLDLKVTSPSGTIYHGNVGLDVGTESTPGGVPNDIDTVENVFVLNPEAGKWSVEVSAPELNQDAYLDTTEVDAAFALVVTGGTSQLIQPSEGRVRLDDDFYSCDTRIGIRVIDGNTGAASLNVSISSDSESTPENVLLTETRPGSGKYAGEIFTTDAAAGADGLLSLAHLDSITVEYLDADNGEGGLNELRIDTAEADCQRPIIANIAEEGISDVSATVVWDTDEQSEGEIVWGETTPPTNVASQFGLLTEHSITLNGLQECTVYFYEVRSTDRHGNESVDDNGGQFYYFETFGDFGNGLQPCSAGQATIGNNFYSCNDSVDFQVVDLDLNTDPLLAETATLFLSSSSETVEEMIVATETGPNTSVFSGTITTALGAPAPDGILQVQDGDIITVSYRDTDDGTGRSSISFDSATADCAGPVIQNVVIGDVRDDRFTVTWDTSELTDTVIEWGETPALGNVISDGALVSSHAGTIRPIELCSEAYVRISATDAYGNTTVSDVNGQPFSAQTFDIPGLYYRESFEADNGDWTMEGEWEIGAPQGLGGSSGPADPTEAYHKFGVLGHDLTGQGSLPGDYEAGIDESATSPLQNAASWTNTELLVRRQLHVHQGDTASMVLLFNGIGQTLFFNRNQTYSEGDYVLERYPVSVFADGALGVGVRFGQTSDGSTQYSGWTVDDVIFKDASFPDYAACGGCTVTPSFAGVVSAMDNNACGLDGVTVSWEPAFSWGSGDAGTYSVYRDTTPGFTPSAGNRIASGVSGTSYVDLAAPTGVQVYYAVRAENNETCGGGANNNGFLDGNSVSVAAVDTDTQPLPSDVVDLTGLLVNKAHVQLNWSATANAAQYNINRSTGNPQDFILLDNTQSTLFEDQGSGANANTYFYLVTPANACGDEPAP